METQYFDLSADLSTPGHWELGKTLDERGQEVWPWLLMQGAPAALEGRLKLHIRFPGKPLDFSFAAFDVPVVSDRVASLLTAEAPGDVQLLPVDIDSRSDPRFLVNVIRTVRCIDDHASTEVQYWTEEDGDPERAGEYRAVHGMRIDPSKVGDAKVFRPWGWTVALIVSEDVKDALERAGVTGVKFTEVTGPSAISPEERERNRRLLELREQTDAAREAFWRTLGRLDEEAIIPIVVGGAWPARRQVWRIIHRPGGRTLLVTDGLSDFFVERLEPSVGFGLELALETDEPLQDAGTSWPLLLLERVADEVAEHERVREKVMAGFLSMEVSGKGLPEPLITQEGRVGVLLGMEPGTLPRSFSLPAGEVRLVTVKVLLPTELAYLLEQGKTGRDTLLRRFDQEGQGHVSRLGRSPVV
jgi:hypothetical protein